MNLTMDSFVSKLRQTVSQVAYQVNSSVNTIIPGNLIHREYDLIRQRCSYGPPGLNWTVHDAIKRDSSSIKASLKDAIGPTIGMPANHAPTSQIQEQPGDNARGEKQLYSVFVFDKSQIDAITSKSDRETALEHVKKSVVRLTRLRHPAILTVHHPIEESRSSLAFVTEHVYGHLESILKEQRAKRLDSKGKQPTKELVDLSQDIGPKDSDYQSHSCQLDQIQIKAGLLQVCDGLKFLHKDTKTLHRNICLDNIFVDSNNTWKIAGLDFSCQESTISGGSEPSSSLEIAEYTPKTSNTLTFPSLRTIYPTLPSNVVPNWSCTAPEHSNSDVVSFASDIFSLGILTCALLGKDIDMIDLSYEYGLISDTYKRGIMFRELADKLPATFKSSIIKYAAMNVDSRPSLDDYQNLAIFNDPLVQAIRNLDSQFALDHLKKIDFFNALRDILPQLSHQVKINRVAKSLFNELVDINMMPHVLPNILIIAKDSTPSEFKSKIFPNLKSPLRVLEPRAVPILLLDNMVMLFDRAKLCINEFRKSCLILFQYLLKTDQQMQEKCLAILPKVQRFLDDDSMSSMVLPELSRLCKETTSLNSRVKCLECLKILVEIMDSNTIVRQALPIIIETPAGEPEIVAASTAAIKAIVNNSKADLSKEVLAGKLVPFLVPLLVVPGLSLQQFDSVISLSKNLIDRVERSQRELLARKNQVLNQKSSALNLESSFKGSHHFLMD